ncbi:hypothetical protein HDU76_008217 [Blyttiomyces sp. JEL0837]|nr:hypothetical protein HDU76_008217 [Blyttiomyces sp. JEL0837]
MIESSVSTFNAVTFKPIETPHFLILMDSIHVFVTIAKTTGSDKHEKLDYLETDRFNFVLWTLDLFECPELDAKMELLVKLVKEAGESENKTEY